MNHLRLATLVTFSAVAGATNTPSATELRITVYNHANVPAQVLDEAWGGLRRIFRVSGIEIQISLGDPESAESVLISYPEAPRQGLERQAVCSARRDVAIRITVGLPSQRAGILGMAVPLAAKGLNVLVYDDRVRNIAAQRVQSHAVLLAHTMAHEIGHVLLRSGVHDKLGIMSDAWTDGEYAWIARGTMGFSRKHAQAMRATLGGSECSGGGN